MRFLSEDDYLAAAQDAAYDRFLQTAVQCRDCGMRYDQGHHPATRHEPAWSECGECPNCGSTAITEQWHGADWHGRERNDYLRGDAAESSPDALDHDRRPAGRSHRRPRE